MRTIALAVAAGALLAATQANAGNFPVNNLTGAGTGLVDKVAVRVYVHEGHRYCFYFNGWHGPGWYRCGFALRRGFGWGGVYGWNDWSYGPYERRFHGSVHRGERFGYGEEHERRGRVGVESGSNRTRDSMETRGRTRSTTGAGVESNTRVNRSTTGRGPGAEVESHGGAKIQGGERGQGGTTGSTNVRGGGDRGGNAGSDQGEQKRQ
jgi:hypothetical protein